MNDQTRDLLDYENRERVENLSQKVALLKNYAVDIESETKAHNRLLDEVDDDFGSNFVFLQNTRNRLDRLVKANRSGKYTCYMALGVCAMLFLIYFVLWSWI